MKIGKILIGSLLASSSIGNANNTLVKANYSHGLERTLETAGNLDYYNNFVEVQPKRLVEVKAVDKGLKSSFGGIITHAGCEDGC